MDSPVVIRATALPPELPVTIRASTTDRAGQRWESHATYAANALGIVDARADAPTGGSYRGVNPDGLLTQMRAMGDSGGLARFESQWSDTIVTVFRLEINGTTVWSDTISRTFGPAAIQASPITDSGMIGTLFERVDGARQPAVLVLGGSEGGDGAADVAYQLAGHGFTTMSLAYFGSPSLPSQLDEIPLEYFERALAFLARRPSVAPGRIGILATSKGAEAALLIASRSSAVRVVVGYAPSSVAWSCICDSASHSSWSWRGRALAAVPPGADPAYRRPAGKPLEPAVNYLYRLRRDTKPAARIRGDRISAAVLLIAGDDDRLWPSSEMARELERGLSGGSAVRPSEVVIYPRAGHFLGKSILPAGSTLLARGRIETGGSPEANAAAGRNAWAKTISFLKHNL